MKTASKLKEGDPVSALTKGKPLTWAPLVGTNSCTSARAIALLLSQLTVCLTAKPRAISPLSSATLRMEMNPKKKKASSSYSFTTSCSEAHHGENPSPLLPVEVSSG